MQVLKIYPTSLFFSNRYW